ncbi:hypothetical protein TNIN_455371 [Trichonephila inaurata madagascariensis]|uniref:Uncharacterized protein n=1 Tax=Trichonephila inaurata madagascariensis TaxID=2747483 RepID=A0A8X6KI69_9ARAC|nr:hypothetical protein TNIN_455371 [Trichonephila inaurata madagascariensis]
MRWATIVDFYARLREVTEIIGSHHDKLLGGPGDDKKRLLVDGKKKKDLWPRIARHCNPETSLRKMRRLSKDSVYKSRTASLAAQKIHKVLTTESAIRAGDYLLGPRLGSSPVRSIVQCLGKKVGTDNFCAIKILTLQELKDETQDDRQGKMLLHTEYSLLSLLHAQEGVVHHHGLFKDTCLEEIRTTDNRLFIGRRNRVCLVLDCLCAHEFSSETAALINLQHYVIREKKLCEKEAILIFHDVVSVVSDLHRV